MGFGGPPHTVPPTKYQLKLPVFSSGSGVGRGKVTSGCLFLASKRLPAPQHQQTTPAPREGETALPESDGTLYGPSAAV